MSYKPRGSLVAVVLVPLRSRIMYTQPDKQKKEKNTISPFFFPKTTSYKKTKNKETSRWANQRIDLFSGEYKAKERKLLLLLFIFWRPSSPGPLRNKGSPIEGEFQCCMEAEEEKREESVNLNAKKKKKKDIAPQAIDIFLYNIIPCYSISLASGPAAR